MEIFLLRAFDIANFRKFRPNPPGFTDEEAAEKFCNNRNEEAKGKIFYSYEKVYISESKAKDLYS